MPAKINQHWELDYHEETRHFPLLPPTSFYVFLIFIKKMTFFFFFLIGLWLLLATELSCPQFWLPGESEFLFSGWKPPLKGSDWPSSGQVTTAGPITCG